jgi:tetratricopeptide (TPR) repeat protein
LLLKHDIIPTNLAHGIIFRGLFYLLLSQLQFFMKKNLIFLLIVTCISALVISCNTDGNKQTNSPTPNTTTSGEKVDSALAELNLMIANDPNNYLNYLQRAKYFGDNLAFDKAFEDIARALKADSTKGEIYLYQGQLHWTKQQIKEAYDSYKTCLAYDSLNTDCMLKKAGIDIALKDYSTALGHINKALKINEYLPEAYYLKGRLYKDQKDTTLAQSSYATAIEVDPNYYDAYVEIGLLYAAQKSDLAKEYFNSAISLRPRSVEAWYAKAMFLQDNGLKKKERYNEAFICYDSILHIEPKFFAANFNKGYIWLEYKQQYDSAAYYFTKALQQYPSYHQAYYNRGLCYESKNDYVKAESDYRAALSYSPQYTEAAEGVNRILKLKK